MFEKFKNWLEQTNGIDRVPMTFASRSISINQKPGMICQAKEADIAAMVHIEELIYGVAPWNRAAFAADLKRNDRLYLVLKNAEADVLGFIGCAFDQDKADAHITNFAVHPAYQRQGIGTYLLQTIRQLALAQKMKTLSLEVRVSNYQAQRLYRQMGFIDGEIKRHYYLDDHEDALDMVAQLENLKGIE
ncbi:MULTISPECIES: ribosomal protein S18-alanine N-acetyltransferase [Limosilactobacillus]|uniref:ribosomal protein S18-alanine N-acetyltransferase n=1 Tax=Limosilactobacillus TaxID=2742598 RepID=UPI0024BA21BA|nr:MULTISPECIES: ribosomal protein S18-alanine N-acetyltransferase [Limosilactobacillus]MDM8219392.1 ribosomal protein S18-alanine N-acetyltransferase [Limosilactobacillus mucosae]MDM8313978.1 ribosomal protein S18-alanine N-acetyltransferase [Limosilactobacillus mucosae]